MGAFFGRKTFDKKQVANPWQLPRISHNPLVFKSFLYRPTAHHPLGPPIRNTHNAQPSHKPSKNAPVSMIRISRVWLAKVPVPGPSVTFCSNMAILVMMISGLRMN